MTVMEQYAELYKERKDRVTRTVLALVILLILTSADAANRWVTFYDVQPRAQAVLYKFCKEQAPVLSAWTQQGQSPKPGRAPAPIVIRIADAGYRDGVLPMGYVDKAAVPLLSVALDEAKLAKVGEETRSLFGFQLSFSVYLLAVITFPSMALCLIFYEAHGMRCLYAHMKDCETEEEAVPLCANAFAFSRATSSRREGWTRYVLWACAWLFLLTALIHLIGLYLQRWPVIEGVLYVRPLMLPDISVVGESPFLHGSVLLKGLWFVSLLNLWFCYRIGKVLTAEEGWQDMPLFAIRFRPKFMAPIRPETTGENPVVMDTAIVPVGSAVPDSPVHTGPSLEKDQVVLDDSTAPLDTNPLDR